LINTESNYGKNIGNSRIYKTFFLLSVPVKAKCRVLNKFYSQTAIIKQAQTTLFTWVFIIIYNVVFLANEKDSYVRFQVLTAASMTFSLPGCNAV
jgi:hypothetical protein